MFREGEFEENESSNDTLYNLDYLTDDDKAKELVEKIDSSSRDNVLRKIDKLGLSSLDWQKMNIDSARVVAALIFKDLGSELIDRVDIQLMLQSNKGILVLQALIVPSGEEYSGLPYSENKEQILKKIDDLELEITDVLAGVELTNKYVKILQIIFPEIKFNIKGKSVDSSEVIYSIDTGNDDDFEVDFAEESGEPTVDSLDEEKPQTLDLDTLVLSSLDEENVEELMKMADEDDSEIILDQLVDLYNRSIDSERSDKNTFNRPISIEDRELSMILLSYLLEKDPSNDSIINVIKRLDQSALSENLKFVESQGDDYKAYRESLKNLINI